MNFVWAVVHCKNRTSNISNGLAKRVLEINDLQWPSGLSARLRSLSQRVRTPVRLLR